MKTIGETLKDARIRKKLSRIKLENLTKIKSSFIEALEKNRWDLLPDYPVVIGFIKSISSALVLDEKAVLALLRRDYPPKSLKINPNPDIKEKFTWSPKSTFILGLTLVTLAVVSYLAIQYINFIKPPYLVIDAPAENQEVKQEKLTVSGKTDPDATILVNNQPTVISEDGTFEAEIEIFEGTSEVLVIAKSRSGKETVISRKIKPELGTSN